MGEAADNRSDLCAAIGLDVGHGTRAFPSHDFERVRAGLGPERAERVREQLRSVWRALNEIQPDWAVHTLAEASDHAARTVSDRFGLDDEAREALAWAYSYGWK